MRNLTRCPARDDRGAVGVLVGVLLGAGVLMGMTAVVVDVGAIYAERAQLQNGADAGALAVAKACALGLPECSDSTAPDGAAGTYADANAHDEAANVDLVCGLGEMLIPCPPSGGTLTECSVEIPEGDYVEVRTSTLTNDGQTLLPPSFAHALVGNDYAAGVTVGACARASWGPPSGGKTFAATISDCEWEEATSDGTDYAPPPPYPPDPDSSYSRVLKLHDPNKDSKDSAGESCTGKKGVDGPGQFGWVDDPDGDCSATIDDDTYSTDTGASVSKACQDVLAESRANKSPIFIPIYSEVNGTGNNGTYTLEGIAAFIVTGYHLPSLKATDWLNPANDCKGADKCINGFFVDEQLMPGGGSTGGSDKGVSVIKLTG